MPIQKNTNPKLHKHAGSEPRLDDMLQDSIVKLLMLRDRLSEGDVRCVMETARRRYDGAETGRLGRMPAEWFADDGGALPPSALASRKLESCKLGSQTGERLTAA